MPACRILATMLLWLFLAGGTALGAAGRDSCPDPRESDRPYWRRNLFVRAAGDQVFLARHWWLSELRRPAFSVPLLVSPSLTSFPSGHTMTAFTVATVFASEHRDRRWVRWLAFSTAHLVAAPSRLPGASASPA